MTDKEKSDRVEHLLSMQAALADLERFVLRVALSDRPSVGGDIRLDIRHRAERLIELAYRL